MRASIDERRYCLLRAGFAAPGPMRCMFTAYQPPAHLMVEAGPEITLRRVEFADTATATRDSDHARLVASRYNDAAWEHHLSWPDIEQLCREAYYDGTSTPLPSCWKEAEA